MTTPVPNEWHQTVDAKALIAEAAAASNMSDTLAGFGWSVASEACGDRCTDLAGQLDNMRHEAVFAFADAANDNRSSEEWLTAWEEADAEAPIAEQVVIEATEAGAQWLKERLGL